MEMLRDGRIDLLSDVSYTEECAGDMLFTSFPIGSTESKILILISDADWPMGFQPGQLFRRKKCVGSGSDEVLFSHFLIVVAIFLLDPVHPCFQLRKQIRAVLLTAK